MLITKTLTRLYIAPDKGFGFIWGPVCLGTGRNAIRDQNAKNFGHLVYKYGE